MSQSRSGITVEWEEGEDDGQIGFHDWGYVIGHGNLSEQAEMSGSRRVALSSYL